MMNLHVRHLLILLVVCALVFGFKAGERDFWGRHGEARRAEVSREMVVSEDWAVPRLNGEAFITKPPLYYWAAAWMFTVTGRFDELSARLPSIISGTLGVLVTYLWASILFSQRVGFFSGIILATSFLYGGMARTAGVDMTLTFFTTSALCCFTLGYARRNSVSSFHGKWTVSTLMYLLSTVCIALGTLTKNPIGFAVPLLAIGAFILITRDFTLIREIQPWWLLLVFFIIVLPWFVIVYQRIPNFFDVLHQETLGRYTNPEATPHYEPFYYYIPSLGAFAPWVMFLPGVVVSLINKKKQQISRSHLFVIIAFVSAFVLFSSVGSKREYYLLPLYPFLAILVAKYWDEYLFVKKTTTRRWTWKMLDIPVVAFAGTLCLAGVGLPIAARLYLPHYLMLSLIFGLLLSGSGIAIFVTFFRSQPQGMFGAYSAATILLYLFVLMTIVPEMDVYRSRKGFFHEVAAIIGNQPVIDYNYEGYAPQFYLQRIIPVFKEVDELKEFLTREQSAFIFMPYKHYEKLRREYSGLAGKFEVVLDRTWTSATNPKKQKRLVLLKY